MSRFVYRRILIHLLLVVGLYGLLFSLALFLEQGVFPSLAFLIVVPSSLLIAVYIYRRGVAGEEFLIQRQERRLLIYTLIVDCLVIVTVSTYVVVGTTLGVTGLLVIVIPPVLGLVVEAFSLGPRLEAAKRLPRRYPEWVGRRENARELWLGLVWLAAAGFAVIVGVVRMERVEWQLEGMEAAEEVDAGEDEDPSDPAVIIRRLRAAVEAGDPRAMVELGRIFYDSSHPLYRRDPAAGLQLFRQAAANKSAEGAALLGVHLYDRARSPDDIAEAINYLRHGVKGRHDGALFRYGEAHEMGRGVERDLKIARANYLIAAERGNTDAAYRLGVMARDGVIAEPDFVAAHRWLSAAADGGNSDAENALALLYLLGRGVESNVDIAVELFESAVAAGNSEAQFNYGVLRYLGEAIEQDYAIARRCFEALVAGGDPRGAAFLGEMYLHGRGVPVDLAVAYGHFRHAADANLPAAAFQLGNMYLQGQGVPVDVAEGMLLLRRAAELDYGRAQYALGLLAAKGEIVKRDPIDAWRWLALAAEHNIPSAANALADLTEGMSESEVWTARAMVFQFKREKQIDRPNPLPLLE